VVGGRQLRETLARGLLISSADGAIEPTLLGLIAFVTNLPVPALNDSCGNREMFVGSEVLTAMAMMNSVFWDRALCSPLKISLYFRRICSLHLQGRRINQARNRHEEGSKQSLHACLFLGLLFGREDGGDMFIRNAGLLSTYYTTLYPRRQKCS
jgi:hypothetical protein